MFTTLPSLLFHEYDGRDVPFRQAQRENFSANKLLPQATIFGYSVLKTWRQFKTSQNTSIM